jgi:hypothetical protein
MLARQLYREARELLSQKSAIAPPLLDETGKFKLTTLSEILQSGDVSVKLEAIQQASFQGNPQVLSLFRSALAEETDLWVLASLIKAIGAVGSSGEIHLIQPYLKHEDLRIQANAIEALELIGDELSFSLVAPMLHSSDDRIRANAIKCLVCFDSNEALDTLSRMAESDTVSSRESAVYCMGILDHPRISVIVANMLLRETQEGLLIRQLTILASEGGRVSLGPLASLRINLTGSLQERATHALDQVRSRLGVQGVEIERLRNEFEAEFLRSGKARPGSLVTLVLPDAAEGEAFSSLSASQHELERQLKRRAKPVEVPTLSMREQLGSFLKENPGFGLVLGITSIFVMASIGIFLGSGASSAPPTAKPTRHAIHRPIKRPTKPPVKTPNKQETVTIECVVNNIDRKRKSALLKHDGKILSVKFEDTPREGIRRKDRVQIRGHFTGKVRFGARQFVASDIRKL